MLTEKVETGVIVMLDGKGWGVAYEGGGHGDPTSFGWVELNEAIIYGECSVKYPTDVTYRGSHEERELVKGKVVKIKRFIRVETIFM